MMNPDLEWVDDEGQMLNADRLIHTQQMYHENPITIIEELIEMMKGENGIVKTGGRVHRI